MPRDRGAVQAGGSVSGERDAASRQAAIGACAGAQDLIWSGDTSVMPPLMQDTR